MKHAYQGFGLVELLVSLAMGTILLLVLWSVHASTASSQTYRQMLADLTADGNILQRLFSSRLAQAGFWGYRHIDEDYSVTNFVCPSLLGSSIAAVRLIKEADGQHIQISYLDNSAMNIQVIHDERTLLLDRTSLFTPDMVVGIGDLAHGWVTKIAKVSQRGQITQLTLATALPTLTLPAMIAEFQGIDDSVSTVSKTTLGLWERPCDAKRGLMLDNIKSWDVYAHVRESPGFMKSPTAAQTIDGLQINVLLQSAQPVLTTAMRYRWQGQSVQAQDKRFYLPWQIVTNVGQMAPL